VKIIALEEHFVTADVIDAWARVEPRWQDLSVQMATQDHMSGRLLDLADGRIAAMDADGIDLSVLSLTAPALHNIERADAVALQKPCNDILAEAMSAHPDRLGGLATLAMPDPDAAAKELERTVTRLGFDGGMVFAHARERPLDHHDNWVVFEAAEALRAPLYLHPQSPPTEVRAAYYQGLGDAAELALATFGIGWHYDAGLALLRMVVAGVFDRFPDLQVILGHWGEVVLFYLDRIDNIGLVTGLSRPISEYFRTNVYVTPGGIFSQRNFGWALQVMGAERIMFACDYPFVSAPPDGCDGFLSSADIADTYRDLVASGNWERLVAGIRR
jgi:predicted TIM-barrel fold metal-dependent hydrolase